MPNPLDVRDNPALMMALIATLGLSLKGIFAKFAFIAGASVFGLVLLRLLIGLPLFWLAERAIRRADRTVMTPRDAVMALAFGLLFMTATLGDFAAIDRLGAGLSRIVLFTYPLIVVLLTSAMERRWPSGRQFLAFVIAYAGLLVVLRPDRVDLPPQFWSGVGLSVYCAVAIGSFYALTNPIIRRIGPGRFSMLTQTSATIGMTGIALVTISLEDIHYGWEAYFWIAVIIVLATVIPMIMQYEAMRRIGAARVSLIALLGPVITVVAAWFLLDETLDAVQIGGFVLVLAGLVILEWPTLRATGQSSLRRP